MKSFYVFLLAVFLFFCQESVSAQTSEPLSQAHESPVKEDDLIHFGDLVDVDIIGSVEYDWRGTITPEGFLSGLDFIEEPVYALCRSEETVAQAVAAGYSKLLRDPQVRVRILDRSKRPTSIIYGAVKTEQRFQIKRSVYLNELIVLSGGFTDRASGTIQIFRPQNLSCSAKSENAQAGKDEEVREKFVATRQAQGAQTYKIQVSDLLKGDPAANMQILSGDIITVERADPVYVIGGVSVPKQIPFRPNLSLTRAIAAAGGFSRDAEPKTVTVFRRNESGTQIIEADYEQIEAGKLEDISLKPFDIIDVPLRGRGKSKKPPVLDMDADGSKTEAELPLRIID